MEKPTSAYTVQQLARLAGVSVRTLHHYDQLGLLRPSARTAAGYRLYREPELLRLQQILFFKELDLPLREIQDLLDAPGFDPVRALKEHRRTLQERARRLERLLKTIDRTILRMEGRMELSDAELYEGFAPGQGERYRAEAAERWGEERVAESERRVRKMSKAQWNRVKQEGNEVTLRLAALMGRKPGDPEVQRAVAAHHAWIEHFYPAPAEVYRGLAQLYVEHPEFEAFYERVKPGLAAFMKAAMDYYCEHTLEKGR